MPKKIIAIDSQKLDGAQSCAYFYKLKFINHLTPKETPDYFEKGSLLHHGLDVFYNLKKNRSRWLQNNKNYSNAVNSCIIAMRHKAVSMNLQAEDIEKMIDAFIQYTDFWENDDWSDNSIFSIENAGSKVIYDSEDLCILYEVKIDLILKKSNGTLLAVDHKSVSSRREPNELSNQFKGYCWFLDSHSIIINDIGLQKTLKPSDKFKRHVIQYSQATLDEWRENTIFWIKLMLGLIEADKFPRNFTSCDKYSGCQFKELCKKDPEVREFEIDRLYDVKPWDVGQANL